MENNNKKQILENTDKTLRRKKLPNLQETFGLDNWKDAAKKLLWLILIIIVAVFFIRTYLWEKDYYNRMEGSERAVAENLNLEEELIEVAPSEPEVAEYVVPAKNPRYLSIEKLGISKARILKMGLKPNGALNAPNNIFDVGWYGESGTPGSGGTLVIDGHNGGPNVQGVFKKLDSLVEGDIIKIERGDGEFFSYSVVENSAIPLDEADAYMAKALISPISGKESVTLITCSGDWSNVKKTYLSRQFVRAVLIEE